MGGKFTPGTPKPPGSGRQKGTPNKRSTEIQERLEHLGCDPIEVLAAIATANRKALKLPAKERVSVDARLWAAKELAQYVAPKLKAVEVSGPEGGPIQATTTLDLTKLNDAQLRTLQSLMALATADAGATSGGGGAPT